MSFGLFEFEELQVTAGRNAESLRETRAKTAELTRTVQRLCGEVESAKAQVSTARSGCSSRAEGDLWSGEVP